MHEGAIMVSVHSLTQDSRNVLNRPRTGKNPFFKFFRPDFWTDLNDCRQRLLFARQLIPRKCSLCSQGTIGRIVSLKLNCLTANNFDPINVHFRCKKSQKTVYYTHTEIDSLKGHVVNFPTQIDQFYSLPFGQAVASMYLLPKSHVK